MEKRELSESGGCAGGCGVFAYLSDCARVLKFSLLATLNSENGAILAENTHDYIYIFIIACQSFHRQIDYITLHYGT